VDLHRLLAALDQIIVASWPILGSVGLRLTIISGWSLIDRSGV
jgi:hypothetical protein